MSKVTIVGAGFVGSTAALLVEQKGLADVVLLDVADGVARGKALDMRQMRAMDPGMSLVTGTGDYADSAGSDLVVITAGVARKPGMLREELIAINSGVVSSVIDAALAASPEALIMCVTNPLDVMTWLAHKRSGLPAQRVFGMGGVLDSARLVASISAELDVAIAEVKGLVIGAHGEGMVPLVDEATVGGRPLREVASDAQLDAIVEHTVHGGAEIVALLQTGSAYFAPGAAIAKMVEACLTDSDEVMSVCAWLEGEYGLRDLYLNVPVRLGRQGVREVVELKISDAERAALEESAASVRAQLSEAGLRS
ncbi:MAG: malate dehydrogenase [Actinomycetia bacterium]|nr:malate dehydrogenase [Actinomycetes bacterium]